MTNAHPLVGDLLKASSVGTPSRDRLLPVPWAPAANSHGEKHVYEGALLIDALAKVGTPAGKAIHGPEMADVVLVKARDGYQVAFGLAELDPGTRPNRIILADKVDGAPLGGKDGAFRLVAEGDLRPARSARMVSEVEVMRLAKP
ncbi:hypothetical protein BH10PSE3_BH10PSE3_10210 [soil metagenome]